MKLARRSIICWSALLLLVLAGCGSATTQPSAAHAGATPTPPLPTPTFGVVALHPPDHDPFQANFSERATIAACPASSRPIDTCFGVTGYGISTPYGDISFSSFDINFLVPGKPPLDYRHDQGYCEPTTRQGTIAIGQDMVQFTASGTWCWPLVHFDYRITGGTGAFLHAHGKGAIDIPNSPDGLVEYWTGTLAP